MDEIDKTILTFLQEDGRLSITELAKKIGLSSPATNERVKKLEDKQIIIGYRAVVNPEKIGRPITAHILYNTTRCKPFVHFCKEQPDIVECTRLAGQYDYLIKVVTTSVHSLETIIDASMEYGKPSSLINLSTPISHKSLF
ncbi:Lrp/AsnC family transcriptional regulator [Alkalicoccobacillus murimartini]|uniref:DNA-binding Lrp family transcriptional regulator n=1 Tax=Alkalicoccobacillus murimartini TaxID=171685 RepID=A0ABT9YMN0_9BACI|nr:Lrp/AsnC family transcriptional regulator [Alkalicoccobacillus murimartini]MDQ0208740.1 DNA-binding Lrp family transcriptional regulator [Alkalicoccobacillus murimartini]